MKKPFIFISGLLLMLVGVLGLIMPIMPGWPLIFLGLSLLAPSAAFRLRHKVEQFLFKRDVVYFPEWKKDGVHAGVTTKFSSVHLKKTDDLDLEENQHKLKTALVQSPSMISKKVSFGSFAYLHQIHGGVVKVLEAEEAKAGFYRLDETDGVITNVPGLTILAMTADCLSIFFRAPGWVGVVHAGWRGSQKKITATAIRLIREKSGCKASDIHLIFGPSICGKHYEVGEEFKEHFSSAVLQRRNKKLYFDLVKENKRQAMAAGIPSDNIAISGFCTISENKHFYSFRAEKESAGRMISFIQLAPR